jgi:hypothetical protein
MRLGVLFFALAYVLGCCACGQTNAGTKAPATNASESVASKSSKFVLDPPQQTATSSGNPATKVDFPTQIKPILEARCQPCHFSGGKVYTKMPFDRPETIRTLGTKLFTRIKDENERGLIRDFLANN